MVTPSESPRGPINTYNRQRIIHDKVIIRFIQRSILILPLFVQIKNTIVDQCPVTSSSIQEITIRYES